MNKLNRSFTIKEKIILFLMIAFLIGLMYYYFIDKPVRKGVAEAKENTETLETLNSGLEARLAMLSETQYELDYLREMDSNLSYLQSYNFGESEMDYLHLILEDTRAYQINFSNVTREGDLIRRQVSLSFDTDTYKEAENIISLLAKGETRAIVTDASIRKVQVRSRYIESYQDVLEEYYASSCVVVFYETMVDGKSDDGLPVDDSEE